MSRFEVIVGGSGPAGIEAALVLRELAGSLVETTLVTPDEECVHLPMTVLTPFARSGSTRYPLADLVSDAHAILRRGTIDARSMREHEKFASTMARHSPTTPSSSPSAASSTPYQRALAFGAPGAEQRMHGLIQDIEAGYVKRVAFVVPLGVSSAAASTSWPS